MKILDYIKENKTVLPFWGVLYIILWLQAVAQTKSLLEATLFPLVMLASVYPFTTYLSNSLLQKAMKKRTVGYFIIQFIVFSAIVGAISFFYLYLFSYLEQIGIFPYSTYFDMDVPTYYVLVFFSSGIAINTCICGVCFFQENIKLKKTVLEYQLRTLEQQITPHFMFNVLNHINILMQEDVNVASSVLVKFSKILRYQLNNRKNGNISVEEEVQFLKDFVDIEKIRWGSELKVNCSWKVEDGEKELPALLLIIFIENAFKHVSRGISENPYVNIIFEQKGDTICLDIENSKSNVLKEKDSISGLGLDNIKKRLDILYTEDDYSLTIKDSETIYKTKLSIKI